MTASTTPSYRQSHLGQGLDYHDRFTKNPRRRMMWRLEQAVLDNVLDTMHSSRNTDECDEGIRYLDFACGTGRVLAFVSARTDSATGIDVSDSMLEVAATSAPQAELVAADITTDGNPLLGRHFDLITAFRFFPNAEPALRAEAIAALTDRLAPGGRIIFNNHRCLSSLRHRLVRLLTLGWRGRTGMSRREVETMITTAGLEIESVSHAGIVPEYEWLLLRPRFLIEWIERLATKLPLRFLSENLIYVCHRRPAAESLPRVMRQAA